MTAVAEKLEFVATHVIKGNPVMRNPNWVHGRGVGGFWIDAEGKLYTPGQGSSKAVPLSEAPKVIAATVGPTEGGEFGVTYARVGDIIPAAQYHTNALGVPTKGVMVTRDAAGAALRASSWPDSQAPCGHAGNSNDDEATFENKDAEGNCIVRLYMRGKGYVKIKIPRTLFFEVVEE